MAFIVGIALGAGGGGVAEKPVATAAPGLPGAVPTVTGFSGPVPILMYHAIADAPAEAQFPELFVPVAEFRDQLEGLVAGGYHGVTLNQVFAAWREGEPIAENPIVISFDDGLRSQHSEALPALRALGWPGVLNLKVQSLDQGELTDEMVQEMLGAGWELDAHTITHADLTTLDGADLRREVTGSRRALQRRFGVAADFFCYPGGRHDPEVLAAVREAGFLGATTTQPGLATPEEPLTLSRIRVDAGDGAEGLLAKLDAAGAKS